MEKSIRQSIPEGDIAKDYLKSIGEKFTRFDKAKKCEYLSLFDKTKYDGTSGVQEHIMKLVNYYNKLKDLKVEIGESALIWRVLKSLPPQFDVMRTSYNTQKAEWVIDEMIAIVVQEKDSLKKSISHSVNLAASTSSTKDVKKNYHKGKYHHDHKEKGKEMHQLEPKKKPFKSTFFRGECKYCKKYGHKGSDCFILKKKNEKQGTLLILACFESNVVDVPSNTWWLDLGAIIHVLNSLQGFTSQRNPSDVEAKVIVGDGVGVPIVERGVVSLLLPS